MNLHESFIRAVVYGHIVLAFIYIHLVLPHKSANYKVLLSLLAESKLGSRKLQRRITISAFPVFIYLS